MLVVKPQINPLVLSAIREIETRGCRVEPEDILWLQAAADKIIEARKASRGIASLVDWPLECGGVQFYPLSFAAIEWLQRQPDHLRDDPEVIAFASAFSRDPKTLTALTFPWAIKKAVRSWVKQLACSPQALTSTIEDLCGFVELVEIPDAVQRTKAQRLPDYGTVITALCKRFPGTMPDHWMWEVGAQRAIDLLAETPMADRDGEHGITGAEITANVQFQSVAQAIARKYDKPEPLEGTANG